MFERFRKIPALSLGAGALAGYTRRGYQYLWLGGVEQPEGQPIRWRILSAQGGGGRYQDRQGREFSGQPLFLLSDDVLGCHPVDGLIRKNAYLYFTRSDRPDWDLQRPASLWQASDCRRWCARFAETCFAPAEQQAILAAFQSDGEYKPKRDAHNPSLPAFPAAPDILQGDRVFFLSAEQAENEAYGFPLKKSYTAGTEWWTRTYEGFDPQLNTAYVSIVLTDRGGLLRSPATRNMKFYARPALNLDPGAILLTSLPQGKPETMPQGTAQLSPVPKAANKKGLTWKLTLLDPSRSGFSIGKARREGEELVVPYQGAAVYHPETSPTERVSAIVLSQAGAVKLYGAAALPQSPAGETRLTLPPLKPGDRLFLFSEQRNGPGQTDFASPLREAAIPQLPFIN